jgi:hypothetical protein
LRDRRAQIGAAAAIAIALLLTLHVERLPGFGPTIARVLLYVAGNAVILAGVLRVRRFADWVDRNVAFGAVVVPGIVLVTASRTTQIEAFVLAAVVGLFAVTGFLPTSSPARRGSLAAIVWAVVLAVAFAPSAFVENFGIPKLISQAPFVPAVVAIVVLALERTTREVRARRDGATTTWLLGAAGAGAAVLSLVGRRTAPELVCVVAWLGLPLLAAWAWSRGRRAFGELLFVASYAWVSRDFDLPVLVAIVLFASAVGHALAPRLRGAPRPFVVVALVMLTFSLAFIGRVGLENGIDFMQLDWGAGAFRATSPSVARITAALVWKHAFAILAMVYALVSALPAEVRLPTVRGLVVSEAFRAGFLAVVLSVCGESFWTGLRVIGDLPHALIAMFASSLAFVAVTWAEARASVRVPSAVPEVLAPELVAEPVPVSSRSRELSA